MSATQWQKMSTEDRKDGRPDPDALLAQVQQEEQARQRGRLKIFFGAAPGVRVA